jgi:DNA repair photolyase
LDKSPVKGRGTTTPIANRYASATRETVDDGWPGDDDVESAPRTELIEDRSRSVISYNRSPDIPFDRSINPYRGCEHGCIYCYARPTHAWLDYSPGIDFETKILYKPNAAHLLRQELSRSAYQCQPIGLGTNTDPWQLAERKLGISREILQVLDEFSHPVLIVTKSSGIERDIDILAGMARRNLVQVNLSVTSLNADLSRKLEPRAATPARRLKTIERLAAAGISVGVIVAPVIPFLNDDDVEAILEASRSAGACYAHYIFIRLPLEVSPLFREWLDQHYPLKASHIMNRIRDSRGGADYQSGFSRRMKGEGVFAELLAQRFAKAHRRLGFIEDPELDCSRFAVPGRSEQLSLF